MLGQYFVESGFDVIMLPCTGKMEKVHNLMQILVKWLVK